MTSCLQQPYTNKIAPPLAGSIVLTSEMIRTLGPTSAIKTRDELVDGLHWVSSSFASDLPRYPIEEPTKPLVFADALDPLHNGGTAIKKHLVYPLEESELSRRGTTYGNLANNSVKDSQELRRLRCIMGRLENFDHQQKEYVRKQLKGCSVYLI
jgi:hypothetical protein